MILWRRGPESNRRIKVLQTSALPLGYRAHSSGAISVAQSSRQSGGLRPVRRPAPPARRVPQLQETDRAGRKRGTRRAPTGNGRSGGAGRNRTGDRGFADLGLTTWLPRRLCAKPSRNARAPKLWSGRRDLNPRLRPWQGRTLPLSYSRSAGSIISEGCEVRQ